MLPWDMLQLPSLSFGNPWPSRKQLDGYLGIINKLEEITRSVPEASLATKLGRLLGSYVLTFSKTGLKGRGEVMFCLEI